MKRLVFTVTNDLNYDQRMQRIADTLQKNGYDVLLIGFERPRSLTLPVWSFKGERLVLRNTVGKSFYLEYNYKLYRRLCQLKPDLICSIDLDTLSAGYFASRRLGCPLVFDAHEYYSELPEVVSRPLIKRFWAGLEAWLSPKVAHNYTVSQSIARELEQRYGQPYAFIPNYPRLADSQLRSAPGTDHTPSQPPFVLYQGALNQGRGLEAAIQAFSGLDIPLHIAGEGDLSQELREWAQKQEGETQNIQFLGYKPPHELKAYTASAWLGLNLLENRGLSYYYSLSNKFFDYIHAGIPQICMDFPEYRSINEQYEVAILISDTRPESIRIAVQHLFDDPQRYKRLQNNCLLARQAFCWEAIEPELLAFYENLFQHSGLKPSPVLR